MLGKSLIKSAAGNAGAAVETDPNFSDTTLLLQADDVNDGSQNNTFLDSSTNNHTITRNGNVTQGSFSPFSQDEGKWGNYFDGSSFLSTSSVILISDDFTIECWVYWTEADNNGYTIILGSSSANNQFAVKPTGSVSLVLNGAARVPDSGTAATKNSWHHIAYVRESGVCRIYVDGVQQGSGAYTGAFNLDYISRYRSGGYELHGWLSNLRVVDGTCLYPSGTTFTPPTSPLTNISGTQLLTCQSNRFVDNSSNAHAITVNGDAKVVPFSPFAPSTAYDPATKGGSGYFGGGLDDTNYVKINDAAPISSGDDFQLEFWTYIEDDTIENWWVDDGGGDRFLLYADVNGTTLEWHPIGLNVADPVRKNEWTHLCVSRISGTTRLFKQGKLIGSHTGDTTQFLMNNTFIGFNTGAASSRVEGYVSDFSITVGSATRSADFAVPTAPLGQVGQETYLEFTNAGIYDGTGRNVLETVGDAQVDTAVFKYGTGAVRSLREQNYF